VLVDSDVLIWYLRGHAGAAATLDELANLTISAVSYMELVQGCRDKREFELLRRDFAKRKATVLAITQAISDRAVSLVERHAAADGLKMADALIAGTAMEHGLVVLTANARHFQRIAGLTTKPFQP
jgi:predicted nucleic acid-binding protein